MLSMNVPRELSYEQVEDTTTLKNSVSISNDVIQALEIARESPEAASHGTIRDMLESALAGIWGRVLADECGYVMSRDEFAIFNFFQDRFRNNPVAAGARKRYWDNLSIPMRDQQHA
ncbi:hypothetical protein O1611_g626 [Lasiodiplodia mahajangana]|uniref:Uncharacterized protein n=1 Tax=Lasiodiplodia mahajangana TaxID=1108764 RepID=A0ACC2K017_9PEZI|nr:hypothetical protein O1611_g626 [Lasiodiplodia mahajangana]